jgi:hypothetical protein
MIRQEVEVEFPMRIPIRVPVPFALALLALCLSIAAHAQQTQQPPSPPVPVMPGANNPNAPEQDPTLRHMNEQMSIKRNSQRQQEIVSDTAHLLELAQRLNDAVSKSNKNELSLTVVKDADEIEKLAKSIRDKMRDGS